MWSVETFQKSTSYVIRQDLQSLPMVQEMARPSHLLRKSTKNLGVSGGDLLGVLH
jgi:hypothetical protein